MNWEELVTVFPISKKFLAYLAKLGQFFRAMHPANLVLAGIKDYPRALCASSRTYIQKRNSKK